jgi:hypothetical protein
MAFDSSAARETSSRKALLDREFRLVKGVLYCGALK